VEKSEFAIAKVEPGKLNALVKSIMRQTGADPNESVRLVNSGEWVVTRAVRAFKVFMTLNLGTGVKDADGFREALKKARCGIEEWADDIIGKRGLRVASEKTEVKLVAVSVAELGFAMGATRADIFRRANQIGLALCSREVGPQMRLQYKNQPSGECLTIGMEPITDSEGNSAIYDIRCSEFFDGWLQLGAMVGDSDYFWSSVTRWVFIKA